MTSIALISVVLTGHSTLHDPIVYLEVWLLTMPSVAGKRGHWQCLLYVEISNKSSVLWCEHIMAVFCNSSPCLVLKVGEGRH